MGGVLGCCFDKHKDADKDASMAQKYDHLANVDEPDEVFENKHLNQGATGQYTGDIEAQVATQVSVKEEVNPMDKLKAQVQACLDVIVGANDNDACIAGFDILHKLMQNILKDPTNDKFRVIKRSNKAVASKLMSLKPADKVEELLEFLGYTKIDDDTSEMSGNQFNRLVQGARQVDNQSMKCKMVNMTPEERKKQELIMKERESLFILNYLPKIKHFNIAS